MNSKKFSYNSLTYNAGKAFLYAFPAFAVLVLIVIWVGRFLQNETFVVIGWITVCSVPFIFQKKFKNLFTRRMDLVFDNQIFLLKEYTLKTNVLVEEVAIAWGDIKSYKFYFSASNVTYLVLCLRNGSTKNLSFKDGKTQEQAIKDKSVFSIFFYFINQYNLGKQSEQAICFKPGFWTTKSGKFILLGLGILSVVAIILHVILQPGTSMFSFMSIFIILGLVIKRKKDQAFYNKIIQLETLPGFGIDCVDKE